MKLKMIKLSLITFFILVALSMTTCISIGLPYRGLVYRSITLTVLDAQTKQPLEGIPVTVVNVIGYLRYLLTDNNSGSVVYFYEYKTNENGIVEIPQYEYKGSYRHHFISKQGIGINIQIKDQNMSIEEKKKRLRFGFDMDADEKIYFRPRNEYKAGSISYYQIKLNSEQLERTKPYITRILISYDISGYQEDQTSFPSGHEDFSFYLERFVGQ
jgi:hypothetical protein